MQYDEIRKRTIAYLQEKNIPYDPSMPYLDYKIRSQQEIGERAIALAVSASFADSLFTYGGDKKNAAELLIQLTSRYNAEAFYTNGERDFFMLSEPEQDTALQFVWEFECVYVLLWALGLFESLEYPSKTCDLREVIYEISSCENSEEFFSKCLRRSEEEILQQADLISHFYWECVDAQRHRKPILAELCRDVVMERHKAFNWLIGYNNANWGDV